MKLIVEETGESAQKHCLVNCKRGCKSVVFTKIAEANEKMTAIEVSPWVLAYFVEIIHFVIYPYPV